MKVRAVLSSAVCLLAIFLFAATGVFAQSPIEPAALPARTAFYLTWRGLPSADARRANALFSLWDDPDFAPVRGAIVQGLLTDTDKEKTKSTMTREEFEQYSTLLENPFVIGYLSEPAAHKAMMAAAKKEAEAESGAAAGNDAATTPRKTMKPKPPSWSGIFFVYDRTGKEELLSKAVLRMRANEKEIPQLAQVTLASVAALKVTRKGDTTYWAEFGKYAISAHESGVFEEIARRLNGAAAGAATLGATPEYQEAQPLLGNGLAEFFVRIPHVKDLVDDSGPSQLKLRPALEALKIDSVHSVSGRLVLEGPKTRFQTTILGDTSPGTPFDLFSAGQSIPSSLGLAPAETISYNESQFDLSDLYAYLKQGLAAAMPANQRAGADMMESMAQARIGMPLADAFAVLSGEVASLQTSPTLDPAKQVYVIGIRKKPEALKLMHTLFSERLSAERNEGDTTFLKVSLSGSQGASGVAQWNFYDLAVTPTMVVGATRQSTLREFLAHGSPAAAAAPGLASLPAFRGLRAQFPEKVSGLYFFDFQKLDWQGMRERWLAEVAKEVAKQKDEGQTTTTAPQELLDQFKTVNLQALSHHLHLAFCASWKDAKGIHSDGWID
jgi:hypothetical protein